MLTLAVAVILRLEDPERTPAIYRCPAKEAVGKRFDSVVNEDNFDSLCIDPKPTAQIKQMVAGKLKFVDSKLIDTAANRKWRDATIAFTNGEISPKAWVARTQNLHETIHFLTSPKTPELRQATPSAPMDGVYSARSVFAEMLLLACPGRPCLTTADVWLTRELPDAGKAESWVLAMRDYHGVILSIRHDHPFLITGKPTIVRADAKPGLLIFRQSSGKHVYTFYFNNNFFPIELPPVDTAHAIIARGLDLDSPKPMLGPAGTFIEVVGDD